MTVFQTFISDYWNTLLLSIPILLVGGAVFLGKISFSTSNPSSMVLKSVLAVAARRLGWSLFEEVEPEKQNDLIKICEYFLALPMETEEEAVHEVLGLIVNAIAEQAPGLKQDLETIIETIHINISIGSTFAETTSYFTVVVAAILSGLKGGK